jgi:pimeloyl-ACP methyl ester carboxylesterase
MDLRHAIEHVAVPSLVIVGDLDRLTPPASAKRLADSLPQGRLLVLEGAGHMAPMERYTQFNRELERLAEQAFRRAQGPPHDESTGRPGPAPDRRAKAR